MSTSEDQPSPTGSKDTRLPDPPAMPPRREYPHPPIQEGLVQFNFESPMPWTVATPGQVFECLQPDYPSDPEQQGMLQAGFAAGADGTSHDFTVSQGGARVIYRSIDRSKLVVLNDRVLSVNSVPPYEGWGLLASRLSRTVTLVNGKVPLPPIASVSVRYINIISIPMGDATEKYFNYEIRVARSGATYLTSFMQRTESVLPDQVTFAATTFASAGPASATQLPILLDIEFRRILPEGNRNIPAALEAANELKALENAEFEAVITDDTRRLFG